MTPLSKLIEILSSMPGIGPRQAERLAYYISEKNKNFITDLQKTLEEINKDRKRCSYCRAIFYSKDKKMRSVLSVQTEIKVKIH